MVPGIGSVAEARLLSLMRPEVTDATADTIAASEHILLDARDDEARALGVVASGPGETMVVVTDRTRRLGQVQIESGGRDNVVFFDNARWGGFCHALIRFGGSDSVAFFNDVGDAYVALPTIFLRSDHQTFFWGRGASAVGLSVELEGTGQAVVIGDDALVSSGVWVRNYDMHAMHDLTTGERISRPPVDTVVERHVWLGQDALLLGCERIGTGAIVGARSLVKGSLPPRVVAAGTPARVIRREVSWGRDTYGMTEAERLAIGVAAQPPARAAGG